MKKKLGSIITTICVILLILGFMGVFDEKASDLTNGAYGDGKKDKVNKTENVEKIELSNFIDLSEDELIKKLDVKKNEIGYYPNDENINFMCVDEKIYMIRISSNHKENDNKYTLFNIAIGEKVGESIFEMLSKDFEFQSTYEIENGKRDTYINKENGYVLAIDYGGDMEVTMVSYVLEKTDEGENIEPIFIYGFYSYDNGIDRVNDVEIGIYSGTGESYISIYSLSYGDRIISEYHGTLEEIENNVYRANNGYGTLLTVSFYENEMQIIVEDNTGIEDYLLFNGVYTKYKDMNFDEVG